MAERRKRPARRIPDAMSGANTLLMLMAAGVFALVALVVLLLGGS